MTDRRRRLFLGILFLATSSVPAMAVPFGTFARGVLGQPDLTSNLANQGLSGPTASTLNEPRGVAVDGTTGRIWVADTLNNRVLGWPSAANFGDGQAADVVLGQADFESNKGNRSNNPDDSTPSEKTLYEPRGVAVDPAGRLYVADTKNYRILRFNPPFASDQAAAQVIGQGSFSSRSQANSDTADEDNMGSPEGVACDTAGNLWCADSALNRVVKYETPADSDSSGDLVLGQVDFNHVAPNRNQGVPGADTLSGPVGCTVDTDGTVYVVDAGNNRVLRYETPLADGKYASRLYGQREFKVDVANFNGVSTESMNGPMAVVVDSLESVIFVADSMNHRVLQFDQPQNDETADRVFGQGDDFTTGEANKGGLTAGTLNGVAGLASDSSGNLYAADRLNNRVLRYPQAGLTCGPCGTGGAAMAPFTVLGLIGMKRRTRGRKAK